MPDFYNRPIGGTNRLSWTNNRQRW